MHRAEGPSQQASYRPNIYTSRNLRSRHCLTKTEISISTMYSHEPCTRVEQTSIL